VIVASKAFFLFLPTVLLVYHLLSSRTLKYAWLTLASWVFYAWSSPGYLWVILALTVIDYWVGRKIAATENERTRKRWLTLSVVSNLGLLAVFKYTVFVFDNGVSLARLFGIPASDRTWDILLPLGISFHTFQGISYTVDVYRRQIRPVSNFLDYALFVAFFPQLAAGPIVRAVEFLPQMTTPPRVSGQQIEEGLRLFVIGLFKKLFIADQLHVLLVDPVFTHPEHYSADVLRWAAVAWAVQIYCDFSGYTDIALGMAKWFGFALPPNFRLPYLATSITDFWRRWHLSLSTWLRDYLYFPLGGSRGSAVQTYRNLIILFVLCGLWHGAAWHWLVYGLFNGVLMSLHRAWDRVIGEPAWRGSFVWKLVSGIATFFQLLLGLVLIRMTDWTGGMRVMAALVGMANGGAGGAFNTVPLPVYPLLLMGLTGHLMALLPKWDVLLERFAGLDSLVRGIGYATAVVLIVTLGPGVSKSFIYIAF
jgi:D-alanyl-lipoteichoic acid acyltransferase DltB (MBOAT superfamily)